MLCQRQFGILPSFFPFILTPFLGGLASRWRRAPLSGPSVTAVLRFSSFTLVLLSLNLSTLSFVRLVVCCFGTMLPIVFSLLSPSISSVLLLILVFLPLCDCVCTQCYGRAEGCSGNPAACPWVTGLASNAAVISAAAGGVLSIVRLLPGKFVQLFPRAVLEGISSLCVRAKLGGGTFDTSGKSGHQIFQAASSGALSKRDAILAIHALIVNTPDSEDGDRQAKKLESTIKALEVLETSVVDSSHTEGTLLYILFKVSSAFSSSVQCSTSFDLCLDCDSSEGSLKGSSKSFSATLKRPTSSWHCVSVLNAFALCCNALGVATFLTIGPFLEGEKTNMIWANNSLRKTRCGAAC